MDLTKTFDVIVVGGGHAGTEAAAASARIGADTLLLTHNIDTLGQMSCNPAIGGIGKGHLVKEVDALGGVMGWAIDQSGIQFRTLNASKGPAVRATRAQADRALYKQAVREHLENLPNLSIFQQPVVDLIVEGGRAVGVITQMGLKVRARTVVLTVGTFLGGKIHVGDVRQQGGRAGDPPANALAERLRALPFRVGRLKTGTPPRIDGRSVNFEVMQRQDGDSPRPVFSFMGSAASHPRQLPCFVTQTTRQTHDIIRENLHRSAMHSGHIEGQGPRYCPSIEDKITRFADKDSHQIFVEPEGLTVNELYPNGISTSLPFEVQIDFVRSITGFENALITRPGYAIEYDYFDPRDLKLSLETSHMPGLFFAGQINGTTGYEEAAAQGLIAGLNAARQAKGLEPWTPTRADAYIGVLIDDLHTRGTQEPYRMFTSRAEYRLLLREDNADMRLTEKGYELGLVDEGRWRKFRDKRTQVKQEVARLEKTWVNPGKPLADSLIPILDKPISKETRLSDVLRRPDMTYATLMSVEQAGPSLLDAQAAQQVEISLKYDGYIARQQQEIEKQLRHETTRLPADFDYSQVRGLSNEVCEKLENARPETLGAAQRISGVTPAAISLLLVHLKKRRLKNTVDAREVA